MHGDHFAGLYPSWCGGFLYCSEITKRLLVDKFVGFDESLLRVLNVGETLTIPCSSDLKSFNVTAFDANHCPGAIMLLFESKLGRILHTGVVTRALRDNNECMNNFIETQKNINQAFEPIVSSFAVTPSTKSRQNN